jgi:hypothetical protein
VQAAPSQETPEPKPKPARRRAPAKKKEDAEDAAS